MAVVRKIKTKQPWVRWCAILAVAAMAIAHGARGEGVRVEELHPFTHVAAIPATSDPATLRFEGVRAVTVFTKTRTRLDAEYCEGVTHRDPGGSMFCPARQDAAATRAYAVTYSYRGEPLASDEQGGRSFTFQVYFRAEELPSALRTAINAHAIHGAEAAPYFRVTALRQTVQDAVIDQAHSIFCEGNFIEGLWTRTNAQCQDKIRVKTVSRPSDYFVVTVDPVSSGRQQASTPAVLDASLSRGAD